MEIEFLLWTCFTSVLYDLFDAFSVLFIPQSILNWSENFEDALKITGKNPSEIKKAWQEFFTCSFIYLQLWEAFKNSCIWRNFCHSVFLMFVICSAVNGDANVMCGNPENVEQAQVKLFDRVKLRSETYVETLQHQQVAIYVCKSIDIVCQ